MFWEIFYSLCVENGTKPNPVAKELGISSGVVSKWKNQNTLPTCEMLILLSDYFNCSLDYLVGRSSVRTLASGSENNVGMSLSDDELRVIEKYRTLDKDGMDAVRGVLLSEQRSVESQPGERQTEAI